MHEHEDMIPEHDMMPGHGTMPGHEHMAGGGHDMLSGSHAEHMAAFDLVAHSDATHMAVEDGDWFDPDTWANGEVPGSGARVIIRDGVTVTYSGESDARIGTIGVEGTLAFATDADSRLVVDTIVVMPSGRLEAGTVENPVAPGTSIDIVIANNGDINVAWDPQLLSRGIISLGEVEMHGAEKLSHLKVAVDPMAGDTTLTLAETPEGWSVGDTIVLAGTEFDGWGWDNTIRQSVYRGDTHEVLTIAAIDGDTITLDRALAYDHASPRDDLKTSVANYSRSITISSEDGADSAVHHRGHVMFMGSDDVDVRFVAFEELGRTDKSVRSVPASSLDLVNPDSNVQGRYSIHLHELGTNDPQNPAILEGNAVFGAPGWGIAHHSSNALLHRNATFDVFGSGFVAEKGDEIGVWSENISIGTEGLNRLEKDAEDVQSFDLGRTGSGFWFQGRMVEAIDNVAAGARTGFVWMTRGDSNGVDPLLFDQPEALGLGGLAFPNHPVINNFNGNETFGSERGLIVVKANPNQGHDLRTVMEDFTAWEVRTGAHLEYTSHYTLTNFDVVALQSPPPFTSAGIGIETGPNTSDIVIVDARVQDFEHAYELSGVFTDPSIQSSQNQFVVVGGELIGITGSVFEGDEIASGRVEILDRSELTERTPDIDVAQTYIGPAVPERSAIFEGTKTDSLGTVPIAAGTDTYRLDYEDVKTILETDGYFERDGRHVFVAEAYYEDRLTGEIVKLGHLVESSYTGLFSNPFGLFRDAVFNGAFQEGNRAPVTDGEDVETPFETPITINVLANDSDPDGDAIRVDGLIQPERGKVYDPGHGDLIYYPDLDFSGTDEFSYWVTDGFGAFTKADVTVSVGDDGASDDASPDPEPDPEPENTPPDAGDVRLDAIAGVQVFAAAALLAESIDDDGDALSITGVADAVGGSALLTADGSVAFEAAADAFGPGGGGFTIVVSDGNGGEDTARITLDLPAAPPPPPPPPTPPPTPPDALDDSVTVSEDGPAAEIDVLANDAPGDAPPRVVAIDGQTVDVGGTVSLSSGATVSLRDDGTLSYDPGDAFQALDDGESATESFGYAIASDAGADSATVRVTITGEDDVEDAPEPDPAPTVVAEAGILSFSQPNRDAWVRVEFEQRLEDPAVVMGPLTGRGSQPATLRVRSVTETGFEVQIDEWAYLDGYHIRESVSWMAVSAGLHELEDGRLLAAGTTTGTNKWGNEAFEVGFDTTPVVIAQVTSAHDSDPVALRLKNVGKNSFTHSLQEEEAADGRHAAEDISWIAVETGAEDVVAGRTGRTIGDQLEIVDFGAAFDETPAFLASMQTTRGTNTATVRQDRDWSEESARIRIEEEQSHDDEIDHLNEDVGFIVLETGLVYGETIDTLV